MIGLVLTGLVVWVCWREWTRCVWVHSEGIRLKQYSKITAIAWADVGEIWLTATKVQAGGLIGMAVAAAIDAMRKDPFDLDRANTQVAVKIVGTDGQAIKFSKADKGCVAAFRFASEQVNPRLLKQAVDKISAGQTASFGKISVALSGISFNGRAPIPFTEFESLDVGSGMIRAKKKGKWLSAGSAATQTVPNAMVLLSLYDQIQGNQIVRGEGALVGRQFFV